MGQKVGNNNKEIDRQPTPYPGFHINPHHTRGTDHTTSRGVQPDVPDAVRGDKDVGHDPLRLRPSVDRHVGPLRRRAGTTAPSRKQHR